MKTFVILFTLLISVSVAFAQTEEWLWAIKNHANNESISFDNSGNSFYTGAFQGTSNFGTHQISSSGNTDIYIAKLDPNGNWLWARRAGGSGWDRGFGISTDDSGNCYVTGYFSGTVSFGSVTLSSNSSFNIFIAKLDTNGNWMWAVTTSGTGYCSGAAISIDSYGNSAVLGHFYGAVDFGTHQINNYDLGHNGLFVAKIDPDGEWVWAIQAVIYGSITGTSICSGIDGSTHITGDFYGSATFGSGSLHHNGSEADLFIAKIDSSGNWIWASKASGNVYKTYSECIATDNLGNCYVVGNFRHTVNFGNTVLVSDQTYSIDAFVAKMDTSGNWLWAKKAGGQFDDYGNGVMIGDNNNCYITGSFTNGGLFGSSYLTSNGNADIFLAKLSASGEWISAVGIGGTESDMGISIYHDNSMNTYLSGTYNSAGGFAGFSQTTSGSFIAKMGVKHCDVGYPNGGEYWQIGNQQTVTWNFNAGTTVNVYLSIDNGINWHLLNYSPIDVSLGEYTFVVSYFLSDSCLIKVVSEYNSAIYDVSDAAFTITTAIQPPSVQFTADVTSGYQPLTVQFTDTSIAGTGSIYSWNWNFGTGDTCTLQNPQYTYLDPGSYRVSLTVTNTADSTATLSRLDYITVLPHLPHISSSTESYNFGNVYLGSVSAMAPIWLLNSGLNALQIDSLQVASPFRLEECPMPLVIASGDSISVLLSFAPQYAGNAVDSLYIFSNADNCPILAIGLRGLGEYVPPKPPSGVTISMQGNNANISWNAVTETIQNSPIVPDYYLVFNSGSADIDGQYYFHGATPNLSYTHYLVGLHAQNMFYRVIVYKQNSVVRRDFSSLGIESGMSETEVLRILREAD